MENANEALNGQTQPVNVNINTASTAAAKAGSDTTVNEDPWSKWLNKGLLGLGAGMKGFAKYYSAARGGNAGGFDELDDDISKILDKRKKEREEREKEGAASAPAENSVGTTDNTVAVSSPFQNAWNTWANQNLMRG